MAETKTKRTGASVAAYLASRASPEQLADCKALMAMCQRVTRQEPRMWGPSIVGYGSYRYVYESGHSGEACLTGFAIRGRELVIYLLADSPRQAGGPLWAIISLNSCRFRSRMSAMRCSIVPSQMYRLTNTGDF